MNTLFLGNKNNNGFAPEFQVKAKSFSAHHYITKRYINAQLFHKLIFLSSTSVCSLRPKVFRCSSFYLLCFVIIWGVGGAKETSFFENSTSPMRFFRFYIDFFHIKFNQYYIFQIYSFYNVYYLK